MAKHPGRCPQCNYRLEVDTAVDERVVCPKCGMSLAVPGKAGKSRAGDPLIGHTLAQFEIVELLGRGGMGAVYKARQPALDRFVAVKILPRRLASDASFVDRFGREARSAAAIRHPNIIEVFDVGTDQGYQYIAMEFIEGETLADVLRREGALPPDRVLEIMKQTVSALAEAHECTILHRDIKPSNILLDRKGRVKVADFGLARREDDDVSVTVTGQALGTPVYMPPEAARGEFGPAGDLYSLGATFYQALAGRPPFKGTSGAELIAMHVNDRVPPLQKLAPECPPALCRIIHRLLRKRPADRYSGAEKLLHALERVEAHLLVDPAAVTRVRASRAGAAPERSATPSKETTRTMAGTPGRRGVPWWVWLAAAGVVVLAGLVVFIVSRGRKPRASAVQPPTTPAPATAQRVPPAPSDPAQATWREVQALAAKADWPAARKAFDAFESTYWRGTFYRQNKAAIDALSKRIDAGRKASAPPPKPTTALKPTPPPPKGREPLGADALVVSPARIEGVRSWTLETRSHRGPCSSLAYSPDGRVLATASHDGSVRLWDAREGTLVKALVAHGNRVLDISWSQDSRHLAVAATYQPLRVWDVRTGGLVRSGDAAHYVAWSPDGHALVGVYEDGTLRLTDPLSGKPQRSIETPSFVCAVAWSPLGERLASGHRDGKINLWDARSGSLLHAMDAAGSVSSIAWSPDGKLVASVSTERPWQRVVKLWDSATGKLRHTVPEQGTQLSSLCLAWSRDGRTLALGGLRWLCLWDVNARRALKKALPPDSGGPVSAAFSVDGATLALGDSNSSVWLCDARTGEPMRVLPGSTLPLGSRLSPDGTMLAYTEADGTMRVWNPGSEEPPRALDGKPGGSVPCLSWTRDSAHLVAAAGAGAHVWRMPSGERVATLGVSYRTSHIALSPDAKVLATLSPTLRLWDVASGKALRELEVEGKGLAWSPDGKALAAANGKSVAICDPVTGRVVRTLSGAAEPLRDVAWSPDGRAIIGAVHCRALHVWDAQSGRLQRTIGHKSWNPSLHFLGDGSKVACNHTGGAVVWDYASGEPVRGIAFSPQPRCGSAGGGLVAIHGVSMIRLYRGDDGRPLNTLLTLGKGRYAVISPDGHFRGSPGIEKELLYVAQTDEGQQTLTPAEFAAKYGWKNDPSRVSGQNGADPADDEARWGPWEELFDGKTLKGWTRVPTVEGKPGGKARVDDGRIILEQGEAFSMIHWGGDLPRIDYELSFETMRLEGDRAFACVLFPIGPSACRFNAGDRKKGLCLLGMVDGRHSYDKENPFKALVPLSSNQWHSIRLRVTRRAVRIWVAGNLILDLATAGHSYRSSWEGLWEPLALFTYQSAAALRNIRLRRLRPEPPAPRKTP